jgi:rare lipoprotein A
MTMGEVAISKTIFGSASTQKLFGAIALSVVLTASCGHKKNRAIQVPPVPQPSNARRTTPPPQPLPAGYTEEGIASWYGIPYHGRRAADGEIYDMETLVAAHRLMPFNTWLRVTNLTNGRTVDVRIIDRGPFVEGRIIDLSKAAARQIELIGPGVGRVRLEVIAAPRDIPTNDFYAVQVGSFTVLANAEQARAQYAQRYGGAQLAVKSGPVTRWRVLVGKFPTLESARELANVLSAEDPEIFIVRLDETVVPPSTTAPPQTTPSPAPLQ